MRRLLTLLVAGAVLAGCPLLADDPEPPPRPEAADLDDLRAAVEEVNELHRGAQARLATVVDAVRELDLAVERLRDPASVDEAREAWPGVAEVVARSEVEGLREPLFDLAHAVDRARGELAAVHREADEAWQREALDAEDEALAAIRAYAEEADRLARTLITHWPTYAELAERTEEFVGERWLYRDAEEATDAYELAVSDTLDPLALAQQEIAEGLQRRDEAAERVDEAVAAAAARWEDAPVAPADEERG